VNNGLLKQDIKIEDETDVSKLVLWNKDIDSLEVGQFCHITKLKLDTYNNEKYLKKTVRSTVEAIRPFLIQETQVRQWHEGEVDGARCTTELRCPGCSTNLSNYVDPAASTVKCIRKECGLRVKKNVLVKQQKCRLMLNDEWVDAELALFEGFLPGILSQVDDVIEERLCELPVVEYTKDGFNVTAIRKKVSPLLIQSSITDSDSEQKIDKK
jgi:hypothetical protein